MAANYQGISWLNGLKRSFEQNRMLEQAHYLTIATLRSGMPKLTLINFRGFHQDSKLIFYLDSRSALYSDLTHNNLSELQWFFPFTNEVFNFSNPNITLINEPSDLVRTHWQFLQEREKEAYRGPAPDVPKPPRADHLSRDLEEYKAQQPIEVSPHFSVMLVEPVYVDQSVYVDKTAVGNSRKTYESLPQPDAKSRRWLHKLEEGEWKTVELNIPYIRP